MGYRRGDPDCSADRWTNCGSAWVPAFVSRSVFGKQHADGQSGAGANGATDHHGNLQDGSGGGSRTAPGGIVCDWGNPMGNNFWRFIADGCTWNCGGND